MTYIVWKTDGISPFSSTNFGISSLRMSYISFLHNYLKFPETSNIWIFWWIEEQSNDDELLLLDFWRYLIHLFNFLSFFLKCFLVWLKYAYCMYHSITYIAFACCVLASWFLWDASSVLSVFNKICYRSREEAIILVKELRRVKWF